MVFLLYSSNCSISSEFGSWALNFGGSLVGGDVPTCEFMESKNWRAGVIGGTCSGDVVVIGLPCCFSSVFSPNCSVCMWERL